MRKKPIPKDPKIYAPALEYGTKDIPSRPLIRNTLADYKKTFRDKVSKARIIILSAWT